jgi:lysozyme family protein
MNKVDLIWEIILNQLEKGFVNDPNDPGGATKYGISARSYPKLDIENLTADQAKEIFIKDFFNPIYAHKWLFINQDLMALHLSAFAFHASVKQSVKAIQKSLNLSIGSTLIVDGVMGPKTIQIIDSVTESVFHEKNIMPKTEGFIQSYYTSCANFKDYAKGWLNRLAQINKSF